jgi:hypothetical protein
MKYTSLVNIDVGTLQIAQQKTAKTMKKIELTTGIFFMPRRDPVLPMKKGNRSRMFLLKCLKDQ